MARDNIYRLRMKSMYSYIRMRLSLLIMDFFGFGSLTIIILQLDFYFSLNKRAFQDPLLDYDVFVHWQFVPKLGTNHAKR